MGQFNILGGNFEPVDYMKIQAGGSHEQNPNGGVQIGVDPNGIPNMVEEGEVIYKDYVYSDNIYADEDILKQFHLPSEYKNKLYSDIADKIFERLSKAPLDNIENNGANVELSRLAQAQEAQKEAQEQAELEEELSKMSPEELAQLEQMLAAEEQQQAEQEQAMAMQAAQQQQMIVPQVQQAPQMMAMGGPMNSFAMGGDEELAKRAAEAIARGVQEKEANDAEIAQREAASLAAMEEARRDSEIRRAERKVNRLRRYVERDENKATKLEEGVKNVYPADLASYKQLLLKQYGLVDYNKKRLADAQERYNSLYSGSSNIGGISTDDTESGLNFNDEPQPVYPVAKSRDASPAETVPIQLDWGYGGQMKNKYPSGGELASMSNEELRNYLSGLVRLNDFNTGEDLFDDNALIDSLGIEPVDDFGVSDAIGLYRSTPRGVTLTSYNPLSTGLRTAGAWNAGAQALVNLSQKPIDINLPTFSSPSDRPRMRQQYARYSPVDINAGRNNMRQNTLALMAALRNSGAGPSTGNLLIAADNAGVGNEGAAFAQDVTQNAQLYNTAIQQQNTADAALAQLGLSADQFNQQMRQRNQQMFAQLDFQRQLQRIQDDANLAAALSSNFNTMSQALSGIGRENFAMNQANTNRALYDMIFPNGVNAHKTADANFSSCGGTLLKKRRK